MTSDAFSPFACTFRLSYELTFKSLETYDNILITQAPTAVTRNVGAKLPSHSLPNADRRTRLAEYDDRGTVRIVDSNDMRKLGPT